MDYCVGPVSAIGLSSSTPGTRARPVGVRALEHIPRFEGDTRIKQPFWMDPGWGHDGNNHVDRSLVEAPQSTPFGSRASRKGREMRPFLRGARNSMPELRLDQVGRDGSL